MPNFGVPTRKDSNEPLHVQLEREFREQRLMFYLAVGITATLVIAALYLVFADIYVMWKLILLPLVIGIYWSTSMVLKYL